jgi:uncharacterized protein (TIGR03067 family)
MPIARAAAQDRAPLKDLTNTKLDDFFVRPVEPKKDAKTGFIVGGKNSTELINGLMEINGRTIAALEKQMRPGAPGLEGSKAGFLGNDEKLLEVMAADNRYVVEELGLTHQELARHLVVMAAVGSKLDNQEFLYHGRRFKVTGMNIATVGAQLSPFGDRTLGRHIPEVVNLDNKKQIQYSLLVPQMIDRYGFYEGKGTPYRVDPRRVVEVFDFLAMQSELNKLQGLWQTSPGGMVHRDGKQVISQPGIDGPCFFVQGDRLIWLDKDGKPSGEELMIKLDPTADPKRITFTPVGDGKKKPMHGIYVVEGASLRLHVGLDGGPAPKQFLELNNPVKGLDGREWLVGRKKLQGK